MTDPESPPYVVDRNDVGEDHFSHSVLFDEGIAWDEEDRIDTLAVLLNQDPQIEAAHREDREFILLHAPRLDDPTLEAIVARAWASAAG